MSAAPIAEQAERIRARIAGIQVPNATALGPLWLVAWAVAQVCEVARHAWTRASL